MAKYLKKFNNHAEYEAYSADTENFILPNVSWCVAQDDVHYSPLPPHDYANDYLTIESLSDNNLISWRRSTDSSLDSATIQWSTDKVNWSSVTSTTGSTGTQIATLNNGDKIYLKGTKSSYGSGDTRTNSIFCNHFKTTNDFNVYGNILSL